MCYFFLFLFFLCVRFVLGCYRFKHLQIYLSLHEIQIHNCTTDDIANFSHPIFKYIIITYGKQYSIHQGWHTKSSQDVCPVFQTYIVFCISSLYYWWFGQRLRGHPLPSKSFILLVNWGLLFQKTLGHGTILKEGPK